jgi:hypothetical protein
MKNTVSAAGGAQRGTVYFFQKKTQKYEKFNSLCHLRNPMFYHIFMLLFGFVIRNT